MKMPPHTSKRIMRLAILAALFLGTSSAWAAIAPTATLKQKNGELSKLIKQSPPVGTPAAQQQSDEIKKLAATLLDYGELTKRAMAEHWAAITPAQQKDLVATLQQLIERNYVKQMRTNVEYQVVYDEEKIPAADEAVVKTTVKVKTKGKSTDAEIVYKMHKAADSWVVWDVITDEVSLMRNYKSQFHKIISEQSFDALLKKMKDKLKEKKD
jgi:phospholipid transport system substrate-binding protein